MIDAKYFKNAKVEVRRSGGLLYCSPLWFRKAPKLRRYGVSFHVPSTGSFRGTADSIDVCRLRSTDGLWSSCWLAAKRKEDAKAHPACISARLFLEGGDEPVGSGVPELCERRGQVRPGRRIMPTSRPPLQPGRRRH